MTERIAAQKTDAAPSEKCIDVSREVIVAEHAGFCFGVQRAVEQAIGTAGEERGNVYTYGPLIHNAAAIADLTRQGVWPMDPDDPAPHPQDTILIRAHGVGRETKGILEQRYAKVVDATCPFVRKIHRIVSEHDAACEQIVITGAAAHPEVIGIRGWVKGDCAIISNAAEAAALMLDPARPVCVVSQTTFRANKFQDCVEILQQKGYDIKAFNTICNATDERQREALSIAQSVDVMLVIGGENSSNSIKLFEICKEVCDRTYFLQDSDDLDRITLQTYLRIGITAGASTPHYIIEEVQKKCQK